MERFRNEISSSDKRLKRSDNRIIAARANLGFAIGEYFPQTQQVEGSSFRTHISKNAPNTINADRDYGDSITGLRLAWELDFWGRFGRGVEAAYGQYAASQDDYCDVQRLLISDIVLAYVQHKTLQHRIATLDSNIAIQKRSAEIAKVRWEKGIESELDYAQQYALLKEGGALYRNQVLGAYKEVEDALTSYAKSIEAEVGLEESYRYAKRSVDIATLQYREGLADYTRVLNSLQLQVSAEDSLAQAQGNIARAYANIFRALGVY